MKQILTVIPLNDAQKSRLSAALDATASITFGERETVTDEELALADAIIGMPSPEQVKKAERISWLQLFTAGADPYAGKAYLKESAVLTNAASAHALSVSEHAVALTFAVLRRIKDYAVLQTTHEWKMLGEVRSVEGARVAVLGLGASGGSYARKMKALGAYVIGVRNRDLVKPDYVDEQYTVSRLDEVLPTADIVTMILPGGDATHHIMDERRLRLMKPDACLINVGRGTAIDLNALKAVLSDGHLSGVALDVTDPEPLPREDALWSTERVFITPHVASNFLLPGTKDRAVEIAAGNISRFLKGEPLTDIVDRGMGY